MKNSSDHQGENKRQWKKVNNNTYNISSIERITRKFLEVSRCSRSKQQQNNVQKSVLHQSCKVAFCQLIYSALRKRVVAWDKTKRARVYGIVWGDAKQTWRKTKWNVAGLKQLKQPKGRWNMKEKKHGNVKLKEEDEPGSILLREKPEECTVQQLMNRTQVLNTMKTVVSEILNLCAKSFWNKPNLSLIKVTINSSNILIDLGLPSFFSGLLFFFA